MWRAKKCCNSGNIIDNILNRPVDLYIKELVTYTTSSGEQKSTYSAGNLVLKKMCCIKDRSLPSQDTAIINNKKDPSNSKELIFKYFDTSSLEINEIRWEGSKMNMLGITKLSSVTFQGKRYNAPNGLPYISIIVQINKL